MGVCMTPFGEYLIRLWRELRGPKLIVLIMSAITGLAGGLSIASINAGVQSWSEGEVPLASMGTFLLSLTVILVAGYFAQFRNSQMVGELTFRMRSEGVKTVARASLSDVERFSEGSILAMLHHDTQAIGGSVSTLISGTRALVTAVFALVYLAYLSPVIMGLALVAIAIGVTSYVYQERRIRSLIEASRQSAADFHDTMSDAMHGAKETRFHAKGEASILRQVERLGQRGRTLTARAEFLNFTSNSISQLALLGLLGLIAFLPPQALNAAGVPVFQALTVMLYLVSAIEVLVGSATPITRGRVSCYNYDRVLAKLPPEQRHGPTSLGKAAFTLSARNLSFEHVDAENQHAFLLGPINLDFAAPELVFITGGNGSGKTTLLKCLSGLYVPGSGEVTLNQRPVRQDNIEYLRGNVASVFHDYHIFARLYGLSMRDNRERIESLLEELDLSQKVKIASRGFKSTRLSTGQRKRLGLLVAILMDRPILILDEFGAEQDPEFRDRFYRQILPRLRDEGRLILAVTHDDRYFEACDRRIHLDFGQVIENRVLTGPRSEKTHA